MTVKKLTQPQPLWGGASGKESACQYKRCKRHRFDSWVMIIPQRRKWQPTPVFLPEKSHGQKSLLGHSPGGCKELEATESTTSLSLFSQLQNDNSTSTSPFLTHLEWESREITCVEHLEVRAWNFLKLLSLLLVVVLSGPALQACNRCWTLHWWPHSYSQSSVLGTGHSQQELGGWNENKIYEEQWSLAFNYYEM